MAKEAALPHANTAQMALHGQLSPTTLLHLNLQKETTLFNLGQWIESGTLAQHLMSSFELTKHHPSQADGL